MANSTVNSVERTFQILGLFKDGQLEYGVSEISRKLGLHKSTVHGILQTLCQNDILQQDGANQKYRLGPGLVALGNLARQRLGLREIARPYVLELAAATGETALLGVFENDGITIVEKAESMEEFRITAPIGQRVPYCAGCFGRAFLAFMDPVEVNRLLWEKGLRKFTATSLTDPVAYRTSLEPVRRQGYALDDAEEYLQGVWAVSSPIFDGDGVAAVLTVVGLVARMTASKAEAAIQTMVRVAAKVSQRLGGSRPPL